jgi:hypothetical protein
MLPLQPSGARRSEHETPKVGRFAADVDASFSEQVFDVPVTQIETAIESEGVTDDVGRKSVAFVSVRPLTLSGPGS